MTTQNKILSLIQEKVSCEKAEFDTHDTESSDRWERAKSVFSKKPFPWDVLPSEITESLKQLARSHATSAIPLPGAAMGILSITLGSTIEISPKESWKAPLIFWFGDIRNSGEGKTPAMRALCPVIYDAQKKADQKYDETMKAWNAQKPKERGEPPKRARGYYITELTIEGLRNDISGHGGTVCILDELSSFLSAQNQYKSKKGNDREAWLSLHDGKPARVVRAGGVITISGSRVNIIGGIQPDIWRRTFGGDGGLYLADGTIYRFLPTYEKEQLYLLTEESWNTTNKSVWEQTLTNAMEWADTRISYQDWESHCVCFDQQARTYFIDWRNDFMALKYEMPEQLRGFFPKLVGYSLRLALILHCMECFSKGGVPAHVINEEEIGRGIRTTLFYMGHIVNAMELLCSDNYDGQAFEIDERTIRLSRTLIAEHYNDGLNENEQVSAKAMGSFLRQSGLTISEKQRANGKSGVNCLKWSETTERLISEVRKVQQVRKSSDNGDSGE